MGYVILVLYQPKFHLIRTYPAEDCTLLPLVALQPLAMLKDQLCHPSHYMPTGRGNMSKSVTLNLKLIEKKTMLIVLYAYFIISR